MTTKAQALRKVSQWYCTEIQRIRENYILSTIFAILVSGSDPCKHERTTHLLNACLANLINSPKLLKLWKATHTLYMCLATLNSGSNMLKQ